MEYVQMTLNDWVEIKRKLRMELLGVKQSFVRIGFALRKIEDQKLYEQDGYKSVAEFAKAEYGLEPSTTSRFMSINREYSVDGYSESLRPEFEDLRRSQLEEMLKLPEEDRQMIRPETQREDIRELKRFNKEMPTAGIADDMHQVVKNFYRDNGEFLAMIAGTEFGRDIKQFAEMINPGGNRSYRQGMYFMMMYEDRISVKKFGEAPKDMSWWEFYQISKEAIAGMENQETEEVKKPENTECGGDSAEEKKQIGQQAAEEEKKGVAPAQKSGEKPENTEREEDFKEEIQREMQGGAGQMPRTEDAEEIPGQTELTRDFPEYCPDQKAEQEEIAPAQKSGEKPGNTECEENLEKEKKPAGQQAEEEKEEEIASVPKSEEKPENTERVEDFTNLPAAEIKGLYGSRKEYLDSCTEYEAADYMAKALNTMRSVVFSELASAKYWEKWLSAEVDGNGEEIVIVE